MISEVAGSVNNRVSETFELCGWSRHLQEQESSKVFCWCDQAVASHRIPCRMQRSSLGWNYHDTKWDSRPSDRPQHTLQAQGHLPRVVERHSLARLRIPRSGPFGSVRLAVLAVPALRRIEVLPQLLFRDVLACLPENRAQRSRIQLAMARHGQRLLLTLGTQALQLDMTAPLGKHHEAEMLQDADNVGA